MYANYYLKLLFKFRLCIKDKTILIMLHKLTQTTNTMQINRMLTLRQQHIHTHTHTYTQLFYCSSGICPGPPRWAGTRKVKPERLKPIWIYWSKRQWVAVASAGLYAKSAPHPRQPRQHPTTQFFTGRMPFLPPNQQCQSTEDNNIFNTLIIRHSLSLAPTYMEVVDECCTITCIAVT